MKAILVFLFCIPLLSSSQEPFQRIIYGPYMFSCDGSDVGVNGGYIFCKNTLVKTDEMGAVEWAYLYNTNAHFHQVKKTFDNCYIATGELLVLGGIKEIMTIKINEQGEVIWYNLYGGNNNDDERSYSICETNDSNYIIAGYTATYGYGSSDIYLLRIDRFGNLRWARTVGEEGSEAPGEVKQLRDGNFLVVGNSNVPGKDYQIYLVKFNNDCYQQSCTPGYFRLGEDISWRSDQSNKFG